MEGGPPRDAQHTVLVADDEPSVRMTVRVHLERAGYCVVEAADGSEALSQATSGACQLVFLDVLMPEMNGWEVLRAIRENPATRGLPVVMLTVLSDNLDIATSWHFRADYHLAKPFDPHDVVTVASRLLAAEPSPE